METVGDARAFLSAARAVSFRRIGVLRVNRIFELFNMAEVLSKQPLPRGPRLTILTNAGGPGVLATDALINAGGKLAPLPDDTATKLNEVLPPAWSHGNPIDILGDADPQRFAKALEVAAANPESDGLLVCLTPQDMTEPARTAEALRPFAQVRGKPVIASWMGGSTWPPETKSSTAPEFLRSPIRTRRRKPLSICGGIAMRWMVSTRHLGWRCLPRTIAKTRKPPAPAYSRSEPPAAHS